LYAEKAIFSHLAESADADMAFSYFDDFLKNLTSKSTIFELIGSFDTIGKILFGVFSQSNSMSIYLVSNPENIFWLIENETMSTNKNRDKYYKDVKKHINLAKNSEQKEYILREYRKKEYLRIAVREIIKACDFKDTLKEISNLASALTEAALDVAKEKIEKRYKYIKNGFSVIGMGKLGNGELNFSSDIDLLFVHKENEFGEYYNRLAQTLVSILNDNKAGGFVYRVDTRLRPGGVSSPLSLTIDEYENYYSTFGQIWEKMALVKAYPVAGNLNLGFDFIENIKPFVYKKSIDIKYVEEIRSLIFKIRKYNRYKESEFIKSEKMDIKKGVGGIREIEFICNYFQLLYGGKHSELQHKGTIDVLYIIDKLGLLSKDSVKVLIESYIFLRKIEHKLQLLDEQQTQKLPKEKEELTILAKKVDMSFDGFLKKYSILTDRVHKIFKDIFITDDKFPALSMIDDIDGFLQEHDIKNHYNVANIIVSSVKKYIAKKIDKKIIQEIFDYSFRFVKIPALFENFVIGIGMINPTYIATLFDNKEIFRTLVKLLSIGYGEKISKNAEFFEDILNLSSVDRIELTSKDRVELLTSSALLNKKDYSLKILKPISEFAEKIIRLTAKKYDKDKTLSIVAYGKLAVRELFVGSDLDIVFVAKNDSYKYTSIVQKIVKELGRFYEVDLRLRPYGNKGLIVVDENYLEDYFINNAQSWEKQAAQKSKIVYAGYNTKKLQNIYENFIFSNHPSKEDIYNMKKKIEDVKGKGLDIKSFSGGITDIDFLSQYLCFKNGCILLALSTADMLDEIEKKNILSKESSEFLKEAYLFYSRILNTFRLFSKGSQLSEKDMEILEFLTEEKGLKDKIMFYKHNVCRIRKEVFE